MNTEKVYIFDYGKVMEKPMDTKILYKELKCEISYEEFLENWSSPENYIDAFKGIISSKKR